MGFVKVVKNKAYFKRYQVKFRRRREGKTDYYARTRLINQDGNKYNSPKYRLVVRFTNRDVICQVVAAKISGDVVLESAYAHELKKYGLTVGLTNYAAAYATGLLCARRLLKKHKLDTHYAGNTGSPGEDFSVEELEDAPRPFKVLLDVGLKRTTTGSRVFAAMKGAADGGLLVPHSDKRFVGFDTESGAVDAETLAHYIYGGHVSDYMTQMQEENAEKYQAHFAQFIKAGITAESYADKLKSVHAAIRADPDRAPKEKKDHPDNKKYQHRSKASYEQRKNRVQQKLAHLKKSVEAAAPAEEEEEE